MKNVSTGRLGFTLIELLVVVLIIGILAAIALPKYQKAVERARFVEYLEWARRIYQAEQTFYLANGSWCSDFQALPVDFPSGTKYVMGDFGNATLPNGTTFGFNKNNTTIQFEYKETPLQMSLSGGSVLCYYNTGDKEARKDVCQKIAPAGVKCKTGNCCQVAKF